MATEKPDRSVWILYRNHLGEVAWRHVLPLVWDFALSVWHPEPQWLMLALDLDRGTDREGERVQRSFAVRDILEWRTSPPDGESPSPWTTDAPTATGWYWHRSRPTAAAYMAYVRDGACVGSNFAISAAQMGGQWQGPLVPPPPEPDEVAP